MMSDGSEHFSLRKAFVGLLIFKRKQERDIEATARRLLTLGRAFVGDTLDLEKEILTLATTGLSK